jgi:hypothetical protein
VEIAEASTRQQEQAIEGDRDRTEILTRELASARKDAEERSMRLAAAHAEILQVMEANRAITAEHKLTLANERERGDGLARELAFMMDQLKTANRQQVALDGSRPLRAHEQVYSQAAVPNPERSATSESPSPDNGLTVRESASDSDPKVTVVTERSTQTGAASPSSAEEPRLLARASALLRQADISSARTLLEHALGRGSARAAFMLAETYDTGVLKSWRARGIPGDSAKARELYQRAQAGGIEDAKERIKTLK